MHPAVVVAAAVLASTLAADENPTITPPQQTPLCDVLCSTNDDDPSLCASINVTWGRTSQCASFYAVCPANATVCALRTTGPQPSTLSNRTSAMIFASCSVSSNASEVVQVLPCTGMSSVITFPPSTSIPSTTEASVFSPSATTRAPLPTDSAVSMSATTTTLVSVVGVVLAIALVSFFIVHHRRRRHRHHTSKGTAHDDVLDDLDVGEGAYMAMSPKPPLPHAASSDDLLHSPTTPTFLEYLDSVDAFRPLWLPLAGVRLVPVKGSSHGLVAATIHGAKHVLKGIDYTTVNATNLFLFGRAVQLVLALPLHTNLTRITGVARLSATRQFAVATEFMNKGGLGHYVSTVPAHDTRRQRLRLCADIAAALVHLHAIGCVYGILHPEKVLLHEDAQHGTLIAKLNLLAMMDQAFVEVPQCPHRIGSMCMPYVAPESRHESKTTTAAGDVYALGVVIGQLVTGRVPFDATYHDLGWVRGDVYLATHPQLLPYNIDETEDLRDLLHACWSVDPSARPTSASVLHDLARLLQPDNIILL